MRSSGWRDALERLAGRSPVRRARDRLTNCTNRETAPTNVGELRPNDDGSIDHDDRVKWVYDLKNTYFGDANLDGQFDSGDFVDVFVAGKYETEEEALWNEGDWTGDMVFDTGDFVFVFAEGGYEEGLKNSVKAVPEPTSCTLAAFALLGLISLSRRSLI